MEDKRRQLSLATEHVAQLEGRVQDLVERRHARLARTEAAAERERLRNALDASTKDVLELRSRVLGERKVLAERRALLARARAALDRVRDRRGGAEPCTGPTDTLLQRLRATRRAKCSAILALHRIERAGREKCSVAGLVVCNNHRDRAAVPADWACALAHLAAATAAVACVLDISLSQTALDGPETLEKLDGALVELASRAVGGGWQDWWQPHCPALNLLSVVERLP